MENKEIYKEQINDISEKESALLEFLISKVTSVLTHDENITQIAGVYGIDAPTFSPNEDWSLDFQEYVSKLDKLAREKDYYCGIEEADRIIVPLMKYIKGMVSLYNSYSETNNFLQNNTIQEPRRLASKLSRRNAQILSSLDKAIESESRQSVKIGQDSSMSLKILQMVLKNGFSASIFDMRTYPVAERDEEEKVAPVEPAILEEKPEVSTLDRANNKYHALLKFKTALAGIGSSNTGMMNSDKFDQNNQFRFLADHIDFEIQRLNEIFSLNGRNIDRSDIAEDILKEIETINEEMETYITAMSYKVDYARTDLPETIYYSSPSFRVSTKSELSKQSDISNPLVTKFNKFLKCYGELAEAKQLDYDAVLKLAKAYLLVNELYGDVQEIQETKQIESTRFSQKQ